MLENLIAAFCQVLQFFLDNPAIARLVIRTAVRLVASRTAGPTVTSQPRTPSRRFATKVARVLTHETVRQILEDLQDDISQP